MSMTPAPWPRMSPVSGTGRPRSESQRLMTAISSVWALMILAQSVRIEGLAPLSGANPAMTSACA